MLLQFLSSVFLNMLYIGSKQKWRRMGGTAQLEGIILISMVIYSLLSGTRDLGVSQIVITTSVNTVGIPVYLLLCRQLLELVSKLKCLQWQYYIDLKKCTHIKCTFDISATYPIIEMIDSDFLQKNTLFTTAFFQLLLHLSILR